MSQFEPFSDPNLLYGTNAGDDTGVYRLREDLAIVQTVDFFTPIVDDPYAYGQIAAANALSDCFTMGAQPITGLNLVGFPCQIGLDVLGRILAGGADKMREAGGVIVGGHSVDDVEPKYGIAVTGTVDPRIMVTNQGAKPGDKLVLTKKIGTGVVTNVTKQVNPVVRAARGIFGKNGSLRDGVFEEAVESMKTLNKEASECMMRVGVNACTDVTGFGLLGHLHNVMEASGARARVVFSDVPGSMTCFPTPLRARREGAIATACGRSRSSRRKRASMRRCSPCSTTRRHPADSLSRWMRRRWGRYWMNCTKLAWLPPPYSARWWKARPVAWK